MRFILAILPFFLLIETTCAQSPKSWLIYFGQTNFDEGKWSLHHEFQYRDHKVAGDVNQLLFRVGLRHRFSDHFSLMGGYAFVHTELEGVPDNPFMENRIFQQAMFYHAFPLKGRIRHRFRLEQRFIENLDFSNRFRYCLFADIPFTAKGMGQGGWYAALYNEVFLNLADNDTFKPFDRNRASAGLGYKINGSLGIQLAYMRQNVGKKTGANHGLLSVHHQLKWN